ncbi:TKL protein kinase [Phytophthora megakarya]|uniref:TKL protein kinase n=1 Tax=Phytophthora megakarya TaxID=4795 RepID=A0A225W1Q4_9STRA|nr:TKL protein kinase [Phytophthora megakarya]
MKAVAFLPDFLHSPPESSSHQVNHHGVAAGFTIHLQCIGSGEYNQFRAFKQHIGHYQEANYIQWTSDYYYNDNNNDYYSIEQSHDSDDYCQVRFRYEWVCEPFNNMDYHIGWILNQYEYEHNFDQFDHELFDWIRQRCCKHNGIFWREVDNNNTEKPNGGCPDELTALNASCTCITGYSETASSWVFHITTESWNSTTHTTTRSLTQSSSDELAINTIRPIWVSSSLESLELNGSRDSLAEITFIDENRETSSSSLSLVQSASNSTNITTFSIHNIDLNSVAKTNSDFVPATVTSLTLRNCNISTLSTSFTSEWSLLQYLDLSLNNINSEYIGGDYLKELNLSHNALAVFPAGSLNTSGLEALYIQGNNIKDFNVSQAQFEQIQGLTAFEADQPESSSTCRDGAWQSAHNTTFCVLGASTAAVPDSSQSSASTGDDDHDGLGLLAYWLIAGAIIVFFLLLLVIWQRRRHNNERESSPIVSPESIEPTTPKYNANDAFDDALNHDNVAPAAYTAKKSADAEASSVGVLTQLVELTPQDTGGLMVAALTAKTRHWVAVKKIRNERDVEREQVEQFVREISLISGLSHPRIVEFIGACWTTPAELSAVTELMERGDLRDVTRRFKRRGYRLTWEAHKTVIALHIAEALTYLHGLSPTVIHRDLKAKNVLLNADMEAKLSDFGIARERSSYDGTEHMTVGIGTSFWIAPEVLLGRDYDERADIYSFGVVLSEIDTDDYPYWNAQHPPQGKVQENEILRLVARGAKRPAFSDDCPPAILELAAHCLRADPDERPSASEIVIYLQQLVQERTSSASFSSISQQRQSFDFNMHSTNSSSPTRTAPTNTIVNLRSSSGQMIQQIQAPSAAAAHAAGKRTKKLTTTTTTTRFTALSVDTDSGSDSRPTAVEALSPAHEMVVSSPQVTHHVVRTKIPAKGKRSTTTATTTRTQQGSTSSTTSSFVTSMAAGSSDSSGRNFSSESVPSSRSHLGPTSPSSLRANHQAAFDNINQQRQLSPTSADEKKREATDTNRQWQKWTVYEDVREL